MPITTRNAANMASSAATASTVVVRRGMGPLGWLTIIFVLCKIFAIGPIAGWSWWLVLLPLYGPLALVFAIWAVIIAVGALVCVVGLLVIGIGYLWDAYKYRYRVKPKFRR